MVPSLRSVCLLAAATATWEVAASPSANPDAYDFSQPFRRDSRQVAPLLNRATEAAPNGYVPTQVDCPDTRPSVRNGSSLSSEELDWLPQRRNATIAPIRDFLKRVAIPGFDSETYLQNVEENSTALPNIGLAVSGGGYRAMLTGAGALAAWDIRSDGSDCKGCLGGLLQSTTYLSALSGGGWLVGSLYVNNFTSVQASINDPTIWQFDSSIFSGPDQYSLLGYYQRVFDSVSDKSDAHYNTSITDYWGRMLSFQLVNASDGGAGITFSSIADDNQFSTGGTPLPILVADGRNPGETIVNVNSTVYEINPWELGTSDTTVNGYIPLKYMGSTFKNGTVAKDGHCVAGFDNAGFVMGTSSSLFNQIVLYLNDSGSNYVPEDVPDFAVETLSSILGGLSHDDDDIAEWSPNPFYGWHPDTNPGANNRSLTLVDGGEDLQNVPYHPHLVRDRHVDVVFSIDSSADTDSTWPNGASAVATYERSQGNIADGTGFPVVPGQDTFINLGLNTKPTFFGCDANNISDPSPLIVYIPNYPYLFASNITTFTLTLNNSERDALVQNGWAVATQLNSTRDQDWAQCVGCAMLQRSFLRTNTSFPEKCNTCFDRYCWNGTLDENTPPPYSPAFYSAPIDVESAAVSPGVLGSHLAVAALAVLGVAFIS